MRPYKIHPQPQQTQSDQGSLQQIRPSSSVHNDQSKQFMFGANNESHSVKSSSSNLKMPIVLKNSIMKQSLGKAYNSETHSKNQMTVENVESVSPEIKRSDKNMKIKRQGFSGQLKKSLNFKKSIQRQNTFLCLICETQVNEESKRRIGKCSHYFCESCVHHYIIYQVSATQEVSCPQTQCLQVLSPKSKLFKQLPNDVQKRYKRYLLFKKACSDPSLKLCPEQTCEEGMINIDHRKPKCNKCGFQICKNCLLRRHEGPCSGEVVGYFEKNLKYRQCQQCKNVIERIQGCDHMKCKCGFRFCYQCGSRYSANHRCRNGQEIPPQPSCYEAEFGELPFVLKIPLKIFFFIFSLVIILGMLIYLLLMMILLLIVIILQGLCSRFCDIVEHLGVIMSMLAIVFFPVTLLIAIGLEFKDHFLDSADQLLFLVFDSIREMYINIWKF